MALIQCEDCGGKVSSMATSCPACGRPNILGIVGADVRQSRQLRKHWALHGWARQQINTLRHLHGDPPEAWPDVADVDQ